MMVGRLFLEVPRDCLRFVIVVFPDHTHLLFLKFSERLKPNRLAILRSDILINKVILPFCFKNWGCVPLSQHAALLIWTALSVQKGYCLDIVTIVSCFSFNTKF